MNSKDKELAVTLVEAWLYHESEVSNEIGRMSVKGESISVKKVAQAYLDLVYTLDNNKLPSSLEIDHSDDES